MELVKFTVPSKYEPVVRLGHDINFVQGVRGRVGSLPYLSYDDMLD